MSSLLSRRNWLKASGLVTAGLGAGLSFTRAAQPTISGQSVFVPEFAPLMAPPDTMLKLRARLLANENPLGIAPSAKEALVKAADLGNRYAWMEFAQLKRR